MTRKLRKAVTPRKLRTKPHGAATSSAVPDRDAILSFVQSSSSKVGKREIAKAFGVKGGGRIALKRLLAEMTTDGTLAGNGKGLREKGTVPSITILVVTRHHEDGDLIAEPSVWEEDAPRPKILLLARGTEDDDGDNPRNSHRISSSGRDNARIGVGDRVLARVTRLERPNAEGVPFEATVLKKLPRERPRLLGIYRAQSRGGGSIQPVDRRELKAWPVKGGDDGGARDGDLVRFDLVRHGRHTIHGARVSDVLGNPEDQRQISLIAVHAHGLPDEFPDSVLAESEAVTPPSPKGREDLRGIPLLTIDPADARDHDDAVFAEADTAPGNPGGFIVMVAIADVAHYVRPASALDREAQKRGNSVYFPDRVVPMLPERISNDLCSLREGEDRPCLAVRMTFSAQGEKRGHAFTRATMRSAAKLSYQEAQAAIDGKPSAKCQPLMETALKPLWAAYEALARARNARGPLDLDLPERKIVLNAEGRVARVMIPERLPAHRLIEEFMIQANVAAAETLEGARTPVVYRIHDQPSKEKLSNLRDFLETLDLKIPAGNALRAASFNGVLARVKGTPTADLVNEVVLRSQSQAEYNIQNIGHFGLNLKRYGHFTSPIRRYADLLVHRALVRAAQWGPDGLTDAEIPRLGEICRSISDAERRAMAAERETVDRLIAAHLADRVGASFPARVAGVTRSGLFVKLRETGADGFVPISSLSDDFYRHDEKVHALVGTRTGTTFQLGDSVEVRLVEAIPTAGALRFEMLSDGRRGSEAPTQRPQGLRLRRRRS